MSGNIPTVYTEDMGIVKNISGLVKSLGYSYSYAVTLKSKREQIRDHKNAQQI